MIVRQLGRLAWIGVAVTAGLGAASGACASKKSAAEPPKPPSLTAAESNVFRFAPPDGTQFRRTDRRRDEYAVVGAPLRRVDEEELTWKVAVDRKGAEYHVKQDLVHVAFRRDGKTLADGDVKKGISAELVIDRNGNLVKVKGLDKTAARLRELAAPGHEQELEEVLTPQSLEDIVSTRYRVVFGETIGRPAAPGSTWTVTNPPGSFVASRRVTVERLEPCGSVQCARLRVDFAVDPRVVEREAVALVRSRVREIGGDPSKVNVQSATYGMSGTMITEPATMLSHGASLAENGRVTVAGPQHQFTVEIKGTTDISYDYSPAAVASQ